MRSLRIESFLLDILFLVLVFATFQMVSIRYGSRILRQEMESRQTIIGSISDAVDSFILAETGKIRFLTPFLEKVEDESIDLDGLLGGVQSVRAVYNVDRRMRVNRILYLEHPNRSHLENVNLTPQQIVRDMERALQTQETVITRLHSSVATGLYSFSFLFPHADGILIAEVDLENLLNLVRETGLLKTYKDSTVLLINPGNAQVHYSSDTAAFPYMQFSPADPELITVGGRTYYYTMQRLHVLHLDLVVLTPRQELESFVGMMRQYLNILLASLIGLALLRWVYVRQSLWRPLARFLDAIRRNEPCGPIHHYREWRELAKTYDEGHQRIAAITGTLQAARDFLRLIIDAVPASVVVMDRDGRIVHWNRMARHMARVDAETPPEGLVTERFPFLHRIRDGFEAVVKNDQPFSARGLPVLSDASTAYYDLIFSPLASGGFTGSVLIILDVTRELRKDLQLQQAQKMDMIGNLAGGLAHDLNNLLGGISGAAEMMGLLSQDPVFDEGQFQHYQGLIAQSVSRAADMVKQLLTLSRKQEVDLAPASLNRIIANVARIAERTLMKTVDLDIHYPDGEARVMADAARLEQVFLNLVLNASHAMTTMRPPDAPQGGSVCVRFACITPGQQFRAKHPDAGDRPFWLVAVTDSGVGMSHDVVQKIFEPFFTTRNSGTGLGLAMVYNIVQYHGGFIDVYSEEGHGSTFNIYLPAREPAEDEPECPPSGTRDIPRGEGTILVVDDDDVMRATAADFLGRCGYTVLSAIDGGECLDIYPHHAGAIDVVLLDMVMPVLSGHDIFLRLRKLDPGVRVLLCSGFKQDQRVDQLLQQGAAGFVQKPYALHELGLAIRQAMDPARRARKDPP